MQRTKEKPYYTRIALLGIAMYLFIEVVILIVTLIFEPSEWAYACIVGGIVGAVGAVIYFVRPWGLIVGILEPKLSHTLARRPFLGSRSLKGEVGAEM